MSNRECSHAFYCWYRLEGRCCHSSVEDISTCKGQEPSTIYVELTIRPRRAPHKDRVAEQESPPVVALTRSAILAAG